jgi:hypothetical protein
MNNSHTHTHTHTHINLKLVCKRLLMALMEKSCMVSWDSFKALIFSIVFIE